LINTLLLLGVVALVGLLSGKVLNYIKVPAVAGYVLIGVILGTSVVGWLNAQVLDSLGLINELALGFIAFTIGAELEWGVIKRLGTGIISISIGEALGAFILVTLGMYLMLGQLPLALILGAVASATAPAATMMVLQEVRAKGILTSALIAVVAIDDAIALILYGFASSIARAVLNVSEHLSLRNMLLGPGLEILGALAIGILTGFLLSIILKRIHLSHELMILVVSVILINSGLAQLFHFSELLADMALGATLSNLVPALSRRVFGLIESVTPPIYCMFFVLAGARLQLSLITKIGLLGMVYILARMLGKVGGTFLGATISRVPKVVRKYLGFGLLSQIGVAVGLAIVVAHDFPPSVYGAVGEKFSLWVINILLFTTIITEVIGPLLTKYAIIKAGEANASS
jgi:Kef-type K+ transport system membrane component KefB